MKKLVLKIDMPDDGAKRKALKIVAAFTGIDSISVDMKERKMTIIGTVDPTKVVSRLRKYWTTELLTVGPAKEPEKKEEPKKEEAKKEGGGDKKPAADEAKKEGGDQEKKQPAEAKKEGASGEGKKEGEAKTNVEAAAAAGGSEKKEEEEKKVDPVLEMVRAYRAYNPHMTKYYYVHSMEENPNACVIC